jgi:hypothetical protein
MAFSVTSEDAAWAVADSTRARGGLNSGRSTDVLYQSSILFSRTGRPKRTRHSSRGSAKAHRREDAARQSADIGPDFVAVRATADTGAICQRCPPIARMTTVHGRRSGSLYSGLSGARFGLAIAVPNTGTKWRVLVVEERRKGPSERRRSRVANLAQASEHSVTSPAGSFDVQANKQTRAENPNEAAAFDADQLDASIRAREQEDRGEVF